MKRLYIIILMTAACLSCGSQQKLKNIVRENAGASISMSDDYESHLPYPHKEGERRDTFQIVDFEGNKMIIMNAVRDDNGEMTAADRLQAAVVTARFRNVAERQGKVDLRFQVNVPRKMQDSRWQLRLNPDMFVQGDSIRLDPVVITGSDYRKAQLRGYQQYERFLGSIITDSTRFIRKRALEIFLQRNIPQLYSLKDEQDFVSDEKMQSIYGVDERQAIEHYTSAWRVKVNENRKARKDMVYRKYVKVPIVSEGLRLDTVIASPNGDFIYEYVQTIRAGRDMRSVDIRLSGDIFESDKRLYTIPQSLPLTFYISSLSSLLDPSERYKTKVIERRVEANSVCWIDFRLGKDEVEPELSYNAAEIKRIKDNLAALMLDTEFDLDSITVLASCSPEGSVQYNGKLSRRRSESVSEYFGKYMTRFRDSLKREYGSRYNLDEYYDHTDKEIRFIAKSAPENWEMLERLVAEDPVMTDEEKGLFSRLMMKEDADEREAAMQPASFYRYMRENLYPRLRTVKFNFYLHRRGMVKDTVHTTVLDTLYMQGVQAIRDRDYEKAVSILRPYKDYNTAVACCAMDYNASALEILENLEADDRVDYLLAILYSRSGNYREAVRHYLNAAGRNRNYIFRGNLDPEISVLIKRYGLNQEKEQSSTQ